MWNIISPQRVLSYNLTQDFGCLRGTYAFRQRLKELSEVGFGQDQLLLES